MDEKEFKDQCKILMNWVGSNEDFAKTLNTLLALNSIYLHIGEMTFEEFRSDLLEAVDKVAEKYGLKSRVK